jgi:hypothetical protein
MALRGKITFVLLLSICFLMAQQDSSKITFNGQVTAWGVGQFSSPVPIQFGGRFVPTLLGHFSKFDVEASLNINGTSNFTGLRYDTVMGQFKPYRVWVRYSGQNWEMRAGLQKINFGSAKLFRPLMWFDGMDVRDPLQLTDGVYGVLGRYYFDNNANLWVWGLIGNMNRKGWEFFGTEQWKPELGGRIEIPAATGEIALSTNFRKVHAINMASSRWNDFTLLNESRIGLDGKWDVGVGLWFESSTTITQQNNILVPRFQDMWNVGADYTLPVGSGLGVTVEYLRFHTGNTFFVEGYSVNLIGTMLNYPLSILDNLSAMVFFVPGENLTYNYISLSRMYDNWGLYAIGYWNPTFPLAISQTSGSNLFAGKGVQLMVNYNF